MEQPFIIKYKPNNLEDFIIEQDIKNTINLLIDVNVINILFVGDSGSGKS